MARRKGLPNYVTTSMSFTERGWYFLVFWSSTDASRDMGFLMTLTRDPMAVHVGAAFYW